MSKFYRIDLWALSWKENKNSKYVFVLYIDNILNQALVFPLNYNLFQGGNYDPEIWGIEVNEL